MLKKTLASEDNGNITRTTYFFIVKQLKNAIRTDFGTTYCYVDVCIKYIIEIRLRIFKQRI